MAARAMWKGVIQIGSHELPVKLYSAVQDRSVRFRLLDKKDKSPVRQQMVNSETGDPVEPDEIQKAFPIDRNTLVVLEDEDLETIEPEASRDIEITRFVDPEEIDHRWYERAYYLGPDEHQLSKRPIGAKCERNHFGDARRPIFQGRIGVLRQGMRMRA